jgi:hypothetical protein
VGEWSLRIDPWPFNQGAIELDVPVRRVPARTYADANEFRDIYMAALVERQVVSVAKG